MSKLRGKELLNRITGVSLWGVTWTAKPTEREIARRLLTALEDKRALYATYDVELPLYVDQSILRIRDAFTEALAGLGDQSPVADSIRLMRAACRAFMDATGHPDSRPGRGWRGAGRDHDDYFIQLGMLRAIVGQQVAILAYCCDIDVETDGLGRILPARIDRE